MWDRCQYLLAVVRISQLYSSWFAMALAGETFTVDQANTATQHLTRALNRRHLVIDNDAVADFTPYMSLPVLPIAVATDEFGTHGARHVLDVLSNYTGDVPKELLVNLSKEKRIAEAPAPFGNKEQVPHAHNVSIFVLKQADGMLTIMRHIEFTNKQKGPLLKSICNGTPHTITWSKCGNIIRHHIKIFQYFLEGLPGFHMRSHRLAPSGEKKNEVMDDDDIDAGYVFIIKEAPRNNQNLNRDRWVTKVTRTNSGTPVDGWSVPVVEKAIRELAVQGSLAKTHNFSR